MSYRSKAVVGEGEEHDALPRLALQLASELRRYKMRVASLEAELDGWHRAMSDADAPDDGRCRECDPRGRRTDSGLGDDNVAAATATTRHHQ